MPNELQVAQPYEIVITNEQKDLVRKTIAPDATDAELQLFFYDCTRRGVHPLDKLIHFTKRGGKYTPITSIDMFRQRASESGEHAGTDDAVYSGEPCKPEFAASVTVYKKLQGERCAFTATARWSEYYPGDQSGFMWKKMPHLMLAKCAEALALRKAFPQQLHGLYTNEEMAQAETPSPSKAWQKHTAQQDMPNIPQVRPRSEATMIEPSKPAADGHEADSSRSEPPVNPASVDAPPAQSPSAFARQMADQMDDQYEDGLIGNLQPYQGTKPYQKGCSPGYFDLEDGQGGLIKKFKYMDPSLDVTSGLKRVYYRTENYKGKISYAVTKIEAAE